MQVRPAPAGCLALYRLPPKGTECAPVAFGASTGTNNFITKSESSPDASITRTRPCASALAMICTPPFSDSR